MDAALVTANFAVLARQLDELVLAPQVLKNSDYDVWCHGEDHRECQEEPDAPAAEQHEEDEEERLIVRE